MLLQIDADLFSLSTIPLVQNIYKIKICIIFCRAKSKMFDFPRKIFTLNNPIPPSDAVWKQKKNILEDLSVQYFHSLKNITPLET